MEETRNDVEIEINNEEDFVERLIVLNSKTNCDRLRQNIQVPVRNSLTL